MKNAKRQTMLIVLDGWGYRQDTKDNAVAAANTPFFNDPAKIVSPLVIIDCIKLLSRLVCCHCAFAMVIIQDKEKISRSFFMALLFHWLIVHVAAFATNFYSLINFFTATPVSVLTSTKYTPLGNAETSTT